MKKQYEAPRLICEQYQLDAHVVAASNPITGPTPTPDWLSQARNGNWEHNQNCLQARDYWGMLITDKNGNHKDYCYT